MIHVIRKINGKKQVIIAIVKNKKIVDTGNVVDIGTSIFSTRHFFPYCNRNAECNVA